MRLPVAGLFTSICLIVTLLAAPAHAERVATSRLLPESTVALLWVSDVHDLRTRFGETAMGRILNDEKVKPIIGHLYGSLFEAYEKIEANVGASIDELLAIPQGEICFALITPENGRPEAILLIEVDDEQAVPGIMLERLDDLLVSRGAGRVTEEHGDIELVVYQQPGERQRELAVFERDSTIVLSSNGGLSKELLAVWEGVDDYRTLADNRKFATIMARCRGSKEERPSIVLYVDPIEIVAKAARGSLSGQAGVATLKGLGLDGLKAVGVSIFFRTEEFDSVMHAHALLATPREGVIRMVSFGSGDLTPEPWVPVDVVNYTSLQWNVEETYEELNRLYDIFRGEGAWQAQVVGRISERLDADLETELLAALDGRVTMVNWMEKPARINSQTTILGVRLKDATEFEPILQRVVGKFPARIQKDSSGGTAFYRIDATRDEKIDESVTRRPTPCFGLVGDYLLISDSEQAFKAALSTKRDAEKSLANELDFKLIYNKIQRQLENEKAGMISFQRPEESFRLMFDLANSPDMRSRMRDMKNPVAQALLSALEEEPLPPFSVFSQYLAPGGAMLTQDETGIHYTAFGLKR